MTSSFNIAGPFKLQKKVSHSAPGWGKVGHPRGIVGQYIKTWKICYLFVLIHSYSACCAFQLISIETFGVNGTFAYIWVQYDLFLGHVSQDEGGVKGCAYVGSIPLASG